MDDAVGPPDGGAEAGSMLASSGKKAGVPSVISINPFNKTELSGRRVRFILQMTD